MSTYAAQVKDASTSSRKADAPVGWGAAVIDEKGNEVPITESMIARACEELATCWVFPANDRMQAC